MWFPAGKRKASQEASSMAACAIKGQSGEEAGIKRRDKKTQ